MKWKKYNFELLFAFITHLYQNLMKNHQCTLHTRHSPKFHRYKYMKYFSLRAYLILLSVFFALIFLEQCRKGKLEDQSVEATSEKYLYSFML